MLLLISTIRIEKAAKVVQEIIILFTFTLKNRSINTTFPKI